MLEGALLFIRSSYKLPFGSHKLTAQKGTTWLYTGLFKSLLDNVATCHAVADRFKASGSGLVYGASAESNGKHK